MIDRFESYPQWAILAKSYEESATAFDCIHV